MSARSKDMIGACLISAGIPMAGEIHLAAGPSTLAFANYWQDWFENDRYHDSTNGIATGYAALTEGRNDVLLVAPRTDHVISTNLSWTKDNCHLIGAGSIIGMRPNVVLRPGNSSVTTMLTADATGCVFAGLTMRNAAVTASTACIETFKTSTNAVSTVMRNCFLWGPEDDTINDATGGWNLIHVAGGENYFENCLIGYGWPIVGNPSVVTRPSLVWFAKSVYNASVWRNCFFQAEFKEDGHRFLSVEFAPAGGVFHSFSNCQFVNVGSTAVAYAIAANVGNNAFATTVCMFFDANSMFVGAGDLATAANEGFIKFPAACAWSTSDTPLNAGLSVSHDVST